MTSREDRAHIHAEIPIETKQAMKDADGPMWKLIDEGVRIALGLDEGSTEAAVEQRLGEVRQERKELGDQLDDIQSRVEDLESMESELEGRLSDIRERKQSHKDSLEEILNEMADDPRDRPVMAWMPDVRDAALREYGSESKDNIRRVIEDLRNHALEAGYAIRSDRLSRANSNGTVAASADGGKDDDLRVLNGGGDDE